MTEIRIDNTGENTWWLYNKKEIWKEYVGCEYFDEDVVLTGNRYKKEYAEASWYQRIRKILNNIDCYDEYPEDLSTEVNAKLKVLYDKCKCTEDIIMDVLKLLYPNDTFKKGTIYGYCQSDWQNYIVRENVNVDLLEAYYFGKIAEITVDDGEDLFGDTITHDELWQAEQSGLKNYFKKKYEISEDEDVCILQANGMKRVLDWQVVE